jgi:hypothetical protein
MGMLDSECVLASAEAATDHTTDTATTNIYDSGSANASDLSMTGENLWIVAKVNTLATSGGSATIQAVLQDSADNVTYADALAGPVTAVAAATVGAILLVSPLPVGLRRYTRVVWRIGTADLTAGKFDAYYTNTIPRNIARPSGFSVS